MFFTARDGSLEPSEFETFKKQAKCLNFLPEYHFMGKSQSVASSATTCPSVNDYSLLFFLSVSDLCPDDRETVPTATEDTKEDDTAAQPTAV